MAAGDSRGGLAPGTGAQVAPIEATQAGWEVGLEQEKGSAVAKQGRERSSRVRSSLVCFTGN